MSLPQLLQCIAEEAEPLVKKKNLMFTALVDPDVPMVLFGDPRRLSQVLTNFVSNAIKVPINPPPSRPPCVMCRFVTSKFTSLSSL